jgi:hypothetical protein
MIGGAIMALVSWFAYEYIPTTVAGGVFFLIGLILYVAAGETKTSITKDEHTAADVKESKDVHEAKDVHAPVHDVHEVHH